MDATPTGFLRLALRSDELVLCFDYTDQHGKTTQRVAQPITTLDNDNFRAFCLLRGDNRQFKLSQCSNVKLGIASDYMTPMDTPTEAQPEIPF